VLLPLLPWNGTWVVEQQFHWTCHGKDGCMQIANSFLMFFFIVMIVIVMMILNY
jgi:hypothetical protein